MKYALHGWGVVLKKHNGILGSDFHLDEQLVMISFEKFYKLS